MIVSAMQWGDVMQVVVPMMVIAGGAVWWVWRIMAAERALWVKAIDNERDRRIALADEFAIFREKMAREVVTIAMLDKFEERIMDGFNRLGDRMDRLIEGRPPQGTAPPR